MSSNIVYIKPKSGWQVIDFEELKEYRDLFAFLVWRQIKIMYAQTILGLAWAIIQPVVQIIIFTIVFGKVAGVPTDGIPYILFSSVAIIPWTYMQTAMSQSSQSLIEGQAMLGKVYFPRLIFPIAPVLARLLDFTISVVVVIILMLYYRIIPTWNLVFFPVCVLFMLMISAGTGMWLSAIAIRYRDVKYAMPFVLRMLIYSAPIVYSASAIPPTYRLIYSLNPIVGVIEGFRATFLGLPMPWEFIWPGFLTASVLFLIGAMYFKRMERIFVDVI